MAEDWTSALRGALFGRKQQSSPRDFWLSDSRCACRAAFRWCLRLTSPRSCTVCYDCDQPFTLLVRRHHCRVCGRIFCSRCTSKSLASATPRGDPVRVCNFCACPTPCRRKLRRATAFQRLRLHMVHSITAQRLRSGAESQLRSGASLLRRNPRPDLCAWRSQATKCARLGGAPQRRLKKARARKPKLRSLMPRQRCRRLLTFLCEGLRRCFDAGA